MKQTSNFENGLIWFGAAISLAEILTGTYFAPLGFGKGLLAIIIGHVIGCVLLFLSGTIGGTMRKSAMESVKVSFGDKGGDFFAGLNIIQLVGWTAIMIYDDHCLVIPRHHQFRQGQHHHHDGLIHPDDCIELYNFQEYRNYDSNK